MKSKILVLLQFSCILLLALLANDVWNQIIPLILFFSGAFVGLMAIFSMKKSKLRITPDPDKDAQLVTDGIYGYVRHPMYMAVLVSCLGLVWSNSNLVSVAVYLFLLIVLIFKLNYEENLLQKKFKDYIQYKKTTSRLIPGFF